MFGLLFALARMATAAWVGAAVLFVMVAVQQSKYIKSTDFTFAELTAPIDPVEMAESVVPVTPSHGDGAKGSDEDAKIRLIAKLTIPRFPLYYYTGATLLGLSWFSSLFLRRRYLKFSRWVLVMVLLTGAAGTLGYDWQKVYQRLVYLNAQIIKHPQSTEDGEFEALHKHSMLVNGTQVLLTLMASLCLCLPGTRPEQPTIIMKQ